MDYYEQLEKQPTALAAELVQLVRDFLSDIANAVGEGVRPDWDGPDGVERSWSGLATRNITESLKRLEDGVSRYEKGDAGDLQFAADSLGGLSRDMDVLYWEWMTPARLEKTQERLKAIVVTADCLSRRLYSADGT